MRAFGGDLADGGFRGLADSGLMGVMTGLGSALCFGPVARGPRSPLRRGATERNTAPGDAGPESTALRRHAGRHVVSPDGIAGCAPVNYEPRTARSDRSSDDSPLCRKVTLVR